MGLQEDKLFTVKEPRGAEVKIDIPLKGSGHY